MNIINPTFSFVPFTAGSAPSDCDYLLPVALNGDIKFQAIINTSGASQSNAIVSNSQKLFVVKSGAVITDEGSLTSNTLFAQTDFFDAVVIDDENVLICWSAAITGIETFTDNTCFRLCLRVDDGSTVLYYLSNCFIKTSDTKYYNTLEYYCTTDNFGFNYCDGCSNKIRLPLYLGAPQLKEDQTVYNYSGDNGGRKLTSYHAGKLYDVIIGTVPEDLHGKITTAFAHDVVNIESPRYTGGIRKDGDYSITWDRPEDLTAPATTKVYATTYVVVNNNCAECVDFVPCVAPTVPSFTLGTATAGVAYTKTITLTGSVPFTLSSLVKPTWLNITVSGSNITFSGTPSTGDEGTGITVSFTVNNTCGTTSGSGTIDVAAPECVAVGAIGSPVFPDAIVGSYYSYNFNLSGTAPFALGAITKPSWMTITISGSTVYATGTPDAEASGVAVSVEVTNCSTDTTTVANTINVASGGAQITGAATPTTDDECTTIYDLGVTANNGDSLTITATVSHGSGVADPSSPVTLTYSGPLSYEETLLNANGAGFSRINFTVLNNTTSVTTSVSLVRNNNNIPC